MSIELPPVEPDTVTAHHPAVAPSTASHLPPGPRLRELPSAPPGYEIIRELGVGGMGSVCLAREAAAERLVAMKFLHAPGHPTALERFLVEVRALARLDHPNIIRVLAVELYRPDPFFTMEYLAGGSLADRVKDGPLPPAEAAALVRDVARAVGVAHQAGVLHRDLKPGNILLQKNDERGMMNEERKPTTSGRDSSFIIHHSSFLPKVSDFGLARLTDRDDHPTAGTGALGTPGYMPPEQVSGKYGQVGPRSDVYGLGATLYHLLTGRAPYVGDSNEDVVAKLVADPLTLPRALRPDVPPGLEAIVVRCLEKRPEDRYESADAVADELQRFLDGEPLTAPELTRWRRTRRWGMRNRRRLAGAGAGVVLAAGLVAGGWWLNRPVPVPDPPPPTPDPVAEMRNAGAAGREIRLIGLTGLPAWSASRLGSPGVGQHTDGTCEVAAVRDGLLELCPDYGRDRYRLTADVRHLNSVPGAKAPAVGVYFGYVPLPGPDGAFAYTFYAVRLREVWEGSGVPSEAAMFRFDEVVLDGKTDGRPDPKPVNLASRPLGISPTVPGPWRSVEVSVEPDRIRVRWKPTPDGDFVDAADLEITRTPAVATFVDAVRRAAQPDRAPKVRNLLPGWSPRAPVGIWVAQAGAAVRNVTLTPLP
jgi:serine/threonine protein kinase